ncbi:MAG: hypothetical protein ACRED7_12015 [Stellaceae bacterium]
MKKTLGLLTAATVVAALSSVAMASPSPNDNAWQASPSCSVMSPATPQHKTGQQAALRTTGERMTLASSFNTSPYGYDRLDSAVGD